LRSARRSLVERVQKDGKKFVELNHAFSAFGPLLKEAFPDAKFIHLVRDPQAVVTSFMRKFEPPPMELHGYIGTRYSLRGQCVLRYGHVRKVSHYLPNFIQRRVVSWNLDTHLRPFIERHGEWVEETNLSAFEKTCWYWNEVNKLILELFDILPYNKQMRVYFEDIFGENFSEARNGLLQFIGVKDRTQQDMRNFFLKRINVKEILTPFPALQDWQADMIKTLRNYCESTMNKLDYF
jgi:hypothetical protein